MKMINIHKKFNLKVLAATLFIALANIISIPSTVMAIDEGFYSSNDILFFKPGSECAPKEISGMANNNIYVVGDSYSEGLKEYGLDSKLAKDGYVVSAYNGSTSRSISGAGITGDKSSGLEALDKDKDAIADSGTALVVLGTNGDISDDSVKTFMDKLHSYNSTIRTFWVNINYSKGNGLSEIPARNEVLKNNAGKFNYTVVDWYAATKDSLGQYSEGIHPNSDGYKLMIDLIMKAVQPATSATAPAGGKMVTSKDREENARQLWQFLVGKGLTPVQAAGVMGNLAQEANYNPRTVEGSSTPDSDDIPGDVPGFNSGRPGYGIVQWSFGRRDVGLTKFLAERQKIDPSVKGGDLQMQADFMWHELTTAYKSSTLEPLLKATSIEEATRIFLENYEQPGNYEEEMARRVPYAQEAMKKWSGLSGELFGPGGSCNTSGSSAGVYGWDLEGPNAMVYYSQNDPKWSGNRYDECTIGEGGCGPTSLAMVIATLVDKNVDPVRTSNEVAEVDNDGLCGSSGASFIPVAEKYGLKASGSYKSPTEADYDKVVDVLKNGGFAIGSFGSGDGPATYFTTGGHFMVFRKVSADGQSFYFADTIGKDTSNGSSVKAFDRKMLSRQDSSGGWLKGIWYFEK